MTETVALTGIGPPENGIKEQKSKSYNVNLMSEEIVALQGTNGTPPYDPHAHRVLEHPTTNGETLIHLIKGSLGTGILAMPSAFNNSGLLIGSVGTILIGILCTYCLHVLVRSQYILCKRRREPILSYPDSMKYALQDGPQFLKFLVPFSAIIVDGFLIVYQLGICCVYIMFIGNSLKQVVNVYLPESNQISERYYMLMILIPLVCIMLIRNLKLLAPFSQLANIITFIGLGIVLIYVFTDLPPISSRPLIGEPRTYTLFIGTTLFALEAVGVFLALENNMRTPASFGGVLNIGMTIVTLMYVFMGFFGYVKYGSAAEGSITLNLPAEAWLAQTVKLIFAVAIFITYALQAYVPVEILWNTYMKQRIENVNKQKMEYLLRIGVVLVTFVLAVAIPLLDLFISLFGALCLSVLGIAFPALIEICVLWSSKNFGPYNYVLVKDILLIVIGIIAMVLGTYISVIDIYRKIN
ncbi:proton-coupled amino acid transporter-like protein CG1139 isoform X2 [Daktulosphaira vitifoliae]|uniref:proton-coupled amino acid transporter-like protein CG1139 isoform X1 n=1 Tax=Daktulosphaira vitifoliae TaxID=58002 RepID=UPI0021A9D588|nr:proton-coupled amino acid transporter-like protein CG1139 isoform X1 [Daktulosphaira vitifoliae]XP_050540824.1 proton-coupled amino acid transporter-like protein CG1139 isoform X2 [Daktulosphaira vitifoliae]